MSMDGIWNIDHVLNHFVTSNNIVQRIPTGTSFVVCLPFFKASSIVHCFLYTEDENFNVLYILFQCFVHTFSVFCTYCFSVLVYYCYI